MFNVQLVRLRSQVLTWPSLSPPPPSSSNSPRAKGNATPTLMGGIPSCSTPRRRPHSRHILSLGPSPLAPSRVALPPPTPLALPPLALPALRLSISLTLTPSPSPLTHTLPQLSSFSFLLHSRSVSVTLTLASRASLDLPPSPSRVASPLVLFARRVLCFSRPPPPPPALVTLEFLHHPLASSFRQRPRLRNCAGKLGMYSLSYF